MHDPFADFVFLARLAAALVAVLAFAAFCLSGSARARAIAAIVTVLMVAIVAGAFAAPPPGGPGPFSDWYRSLETPGGGSCCDEADCRPVAAYRSVRVADDGGPVRFAYEVLITPASHGVPVELWVPVPPNRVLARENPTGKPVACYLPERGVLCFVRPAEI